MSTLKLCDPPDRDNTPPNVSGIACETAMFHTETQESNVPSHSQQNSSCKSWQRHPMALPEHAKATCQNDECREETKAEVKVNCEKESHQNAQKITSPRKKSPFTVPSGWKRIIWEDKVVYIR